VESYDPNPTQLSPKPWYSQRWLGKDKRREIWEKGGFDEFTGLGQNRTQKHHKRTWSLVSLYFQYHLRCFSSSGSGSRCPKRISDPRERTIVTSVSYRGQGDPDTSWEIWGEIGGQGNLMVSFSCKYDLTGWLYLWFCSWVLGLQHSAQGKNMGLDLVTCVSKTLLLWQISEKSNLKGGKIYLAHNASPWSVGFFAVGLSEAEQAEHHGGEHVRSKVAHLWWTGSRQSKRKGQGTKSAFTEHTPVTYFLQQSLPPVG
jgi:hypothetical protein